MSKFLDPKKAKEVVRLYKAGSTMREIHEITGVTVGTISIYVKEAGLEVSRGRRRKASVKGSAKKGKVVKEVKRPPKPKKKAPAVKAAPPASSPTPAKPQPKKDRPQAAPKKDSPFGDVLGTLNEVSLTGVTRAEAAEILRAEIETPTKDLAFSLVTRIFRMMRSFTVEWESISELLDALGYPLLPLEEQAVYEEDFADLEAMRRLVPLILGEKVEEPAQAPAKKGPAVPHPAPRNVKPLVETKEPPPPKKTAPVTKMPALERKMPPPASVAPPAPAPRSPAPPRKSQFDKERELLEKHTSGIKGRKGFTPPIAPAKPKRAKFSGEEMKDVPDSAVQGIVDILNAKPGRLMSVGGIVEVLTGGRMTDVESVRSHVALTLQKAEDLGLIEEIDDDGRLLYKGKLPPTSTSSDPSEG